MGILSSILEKLGLGHAAAAAPAAPPGPMASAPSAVPMMNMWLHKTVLQKLADNGGNVPKELLGS
jgi:Domain of unknown function (DUF3597)